MINKNQKYGIKFILVATIFLISFSATIVIIKDFIFQKKPSQKCLVSPDVIYMTKAVKSVTGNIARKDNKSIWITKLFTINNYSSNLKSINFLRSKQITMGFAITPKTNIIKPYDPPIPYLFKKSKKPHSINISLDSLDIGQEVTVFTDNDLRLSHSLPEALLIETPQKENSIKGKIESIKDNYIYVKGNTTVSLLQRNTSMSQNIYQVEITKDTEISHMTTKQGSNIAGPEKLSAQSLRENMEVVVYISEDASKTQKLTALKIEPLI